MLLSDPESHDEALNHFPGFAAEPFPDRIFDLQVTYSYRPSIKHGVQTSLLFNCYISDTFLA